MVIGEVDFLILLNNVMSCRMLEILEKLIIRKGYSFSRLDGSTPTSLRQSLVDDFNSSPSKQVTFVTQLEFVLYFFNFFLIGEMI